MTERLLLLGCSCPTGRGNLTLTTLPKVKKQAVACGCGRTGAPGRTEMEAINAWNTAPWRMSVEPKS